MLVLIYGMHHRLIPTFIAPSNWKIRRQIYRPVAIPGNTCNEQRNHSEHADTKFRVPAVLVIIIDELNTVVKGLQCWSHVLFVAEEELENGEFSRKLRDSAGTIHWKCKTDQDNCRWFSTSGSKCIKPKDVSICLT